MRDEIENALSYYASTFLTEIPRLYADLEALLGRPVAPFFRMGNWIGGDRDGNPNVDADDPRHRRQAPLRDRVSPLPDRGASARSGAFDIADAGAVLAGPAGACRAIRRRQLASGGRALPPRAHRHLQPARRHAAGPDRHRGAAPRDRARRALPQGRRLPRRPHDHPPVAGGQSRRRHGPQPSGAADPGRAGVRLPSRHHRSAPKLRQARGRRWRSCWRRRASRPTTRPCRRMPSRSSCSRSFRTPARCGCAASPTARQRSSELAVFEKARRLREDFGAETIRHYIISHTESVSDLLEVLVLQKESGLMRGTLARGEGARAELDLIVVPLFETIDDLRSAEAIMRAFYDLAGHRGPAAQLGRRAGHHARLLRQQQGWRLLHRQLGALPGLDRARAHVRGQARPDAQAVSRPRRHRRSRRRPELPGDPGAAARHGEGPDPPHRAGRGDQCEVRQSRDRPAQPRDLDVGRAGGDPADRSTARRHRSSSTSPPRSRSAAWPPIASSSTRRRASPTISSRPRRLPRSPSSTSARARPRARQAAASTTCEPSPGASPGARAG